MTNNRIEREAREIEELIEDLLWLWSEARKMQRQLGGFSDEHEAPEKPEKFDSVVAMLDYVERERSHEELLRGYSDRALGSQQAFEQKSAQLMDFFPDGVPLVYRYQSYGAGPVDKAFEIQKAVEGEETSIEIRELDS